MKGYVNSIESMGLVDGPGVRVVVFLDGCLSRCLYCHNPEMWMPQEKNKLSVEEVINQILKYKTYFESNGGVTFSGGEPLFQPEFLNELLKECHENDIHTCLDTCGVGKGNYEEILANVDLVLFDIKAIKAQDYYTLTKVGIDESLKFLDICQKLNKKMWLRTVILPTINDTFEHMDELAIFINELKNIERVELLPYHELGKIKYDKLGLDYPLNHITPMDKKRIEELSKYLNEHLTI